MKVEYRVGVTFGFIGIMILLTRIAVRLEVEPLAVIMAVILVLVGVGALLTGGPDG